MLTILNMQNLLESLDIKNAKIWKDKFTRMNMDGRTFNIVVKHPICGKFGYPWQDGLHFPDNFKDAFGILELLLEP
jgi:hypothetical protein